MTALIRKRQLAPRTLLALPLAAVLAVALLAPAAPAAWHGLRPMVIEMTVLALLGLALLQSSLPRSGEQFAEFLRRGPNLPVMLLVLYGAVSWLRSPSLDFSRAEWLRLACGAGLFFVAAAMRQRHQVQRAVDALIAVALLVSAAGLVSSGEMDRHGLSYPFGNHQLLAGFLVILVPLLVVLAFAEEPSPRRLFAQSAAALSVTAVALTQTRSAWLGTLVALAILGLLGLGQAKPAGLARAKHKFIVPLIILAGALGVFLTVSRTGPLVQARARTLTAPMQDSSFAWRLAMWKGAWQLTRERPLFGWGIGTFPLEQARVVPGSVPRTLVQQIGPSMAEEAHNEYAQTAAELGVVGLALYLWVLGAFFVRGWRGLRRSEPGLRQRVLMGCLAGLAGQAVDALSNPAWRFADVSLLFWGVMGLGMAAACSYRSTAATEAATQRPVTGRNWAWRGSALALTLLTMSGAWAERGFCPLPVYNGPIELSITPQTVTLAPGQCVLFRLQANVNNLGLTDVSRSENTHYFVRSGEEQCLVRGTAINQFCVPTDACSSPTCSGNHVVPVFATYGQPGVTATARVLISCPMVASTQSVSGSAGHPSATRRHRRVPNPPAGAAALELEQQLQAPRIDSER